MTKANVGINMVLTKFAFCMLLVKAVVLDMTREHY